MILGSAQYPGYPEILFHGGIYTYIHTYTGFHLEFSSRGGKRDNSRVKGGQTL